MYRGLLPATRQALFALLVATIYFFLLLSASWDDSATYDEPVHIFSGYLTNVWGNYQINNFHPPLAKSIAALPLSWRPPTFQRGQLDNLGRSERLAKAWFWDNLRDPQTMLRECRASLYVFYSAALGVLLYLLVGLTGSYREATVLALLAFASPALLGISLYITTDACVGLFLLLSLVLYQRMERWGRKRDLLWLTLSLACGLSSKHSFLLVPAVLLGYLSARVLYAARRHHADRRRWRLLLGQVALATVASLLLTLGFYSFAMRGLSPAEVESSLQRMARFGHPPFRTILSWTAGHDSLHPLGWYVSGLNRLNHYVFDGWGISTAVLGETYRGGRWYYFPLIVLAKENAGVSLLLLLIWLSVLRPGARPDRLGLVAPVLAVGATYFAFACQSSLNIGFRHIAPSYLCFLYASALIAPRKASLLPLLLLLRVASLATSFPHYLSYYNVFAGGVKNGYKVSVISDADWGQDLIRLGQYLKQQGATRAHLFYASTADPVYYLAPYLAYDKDMRPGDLVIVSTTYAQIPAYLDPSERPLVEKALRWPRVGQIGGSLLIFQVPATGANGGAQLPLGEPASPSPQPTPDLRRTQRHNSPAVPIGEGSDRVWLDLGVPAQRALLREGFSWDEFDGQTTYVWSEGASSSLLVPLEAPGPSTYTLGLRARGLPQLCPLEMRVYLNEAPLGAVLLGPDWGDHELPVPAGLLRPERNRLRLEYSKSARPSGTTKTDDQRLLAVSLDLLWLAPSDLSD